ncbi:MAG: TonB-dependent receptor plug domain-containing protein [Flavobacteriales bacterium]|nr:TonB-dependent receptor plug domain-containing protein [Flavobacteriales bacterium]
MIAILIFSLVIGKVGVSQNFGSIKGKVIDAKTGLAVEFANVWVETGSAPIGSTTDSEGRFTIKPLSPGSYDLHVKDIRYAEYLQAGVHVKNNEITIVPRIELGDNTLNTFKFVDYVEPLISPDNPSKMTMSWVDLEKRADVRNTGTMIARLVPGVKENAEGDRLHFRGARPQNIATFIDGVKIAGGEIPRLPSNAIKNLTVYTGGIPASFGDITGGVIIIETKGYMDFYRESKRQKQLSENTVD